jgi:hypothetical protein
MENKNSNAQQPDLDWSQVRETERSEVMIFSPQ